MAYQVRHFGPLNIREYADGYLEISDVACGMMYLSERTLAAADVRRLTIDPEKITCKRCLAIVCDKRMVAAVPHHSPDVHPYIASDPDRFDRSLVNLTRQICGLDPVVASAQTLSLHADALKKSIGYSERLITEGEQQLAKATLLRERWDNSSTAPRALTNGTSGLNQAAKSKIVHLWPAQAAEYADGYTSASSTVCGLTSDDYDSEDHSFKTDMVNTNPLAVTCSKCAKSKGFKHATAMGAGYAASIVTSIPYMRNAVLKHPELYQTERNNALRDVLGLGHVFRDESTAALIEQTIEKQNGYAQNLIDKGRGERDRKIALLAEMEKNYGLRVPAIAAMTIKQVEHRPQLPDAEAAAMNARTAMHQQENSSVVEPQVTSATAGTSPRWLLIGGLLVGFLAWITYSAPAGTFNGGSDEWKWCKAYRTDRECLALGYKPS